MVQRIRCLVFSAMLLSVFGHASCSAQTTGESGEYRKFKDRRGRTVVARVVETTDDKATIERRDGRQFTVDISAFSQADQDYIRGLTKPSQSQATDDNWPRFRGPGGMGVSDATGLPLEWDAENNVAWKTPLPGSGASSPITFGDHIYLTCYSGYFVPDEPRGSLDQLKRHLIALSRDTGEIVWDKTVPAKLPEEERIRDHGFAANTPAADADRVYAFFGKTGVFAFDHEGNQLWQADVGSNTSGWGSAVVLAAKPEFEQLAVNRIEGDRTRFDGSPAVDGNRLLMRSGKYLYCLGQ